MIEGGGEIKYDEGTTKNNPTGDFERVALRNDDHKYQSNNA